MALVVILVALIARDLGGSRRAQISRRSRRPCLAISAQGISTHDRTRPAGLGDRPLAAREAARGRRPALWLAVGVVAGIALENKDTILFLVRGWRGSRPDRRWDVLRSPWAWAAMGSRS